MLARTVANRMGYPPLLIRADASLSIGAGHVMRCLALAQAWQDRGGHATVLSAEDSPAICQRLEAEGISVRSFTVQIGSEEDAVGTFEIASELDCHWVVADGYHFGAAYQMRVRQSGMRLLVVDDNGQPGCSADIVLNHNIHAVAGMYVGSRAKLLLGCRYALIRREFHSHAAGKQESTDTRVLVTMGGSDPLNFTEKVLRALQADDFRDVKVTALAGPANPHLQNLRRLLEIDPSRRINIDSAPDMPALLAEADIAISCAGMTCMELAFMGVPAVLIVIAENQANAAQNWDRLGSAVNLGWHEDVRESNIVEAALYLLRSAEVRKRLAARGRELVGGSGPQLVIDEMMRSAQELKRRTGQ